ncbi:TPA: hypothetical protein ACGGJA_005023, partial [Escherichia coli]
PQYDTELPWFEHTDDRLTEHGQQCPYVRPERREIQLIKLWATQCTLLRHFYSYLADGDAVDKLLALTV